MVVSCDNYEIENLSNKPTIGGMSRNILSSITLMKHV